MHEKNTEILNIVPANVILKQNVKASLPFMHWGINLVIFVVTLAAIGLERGTTMHLYSYFP